MVLERMAEEPQEPTPSFGGHAVRLSQVEMAALRSRSERRARGHRSLVPRALHTGEQTVEGWAANDGKLRSVVQLVEEDTVVLSAAVGRWSSVDCRVHAGCNGGMGWLEQGRIGWKIAVKGKAGAKVAGHIAVLAAPGQDSDMGALAHCLLRLIEVMRSVVSSDGLVHTAERVHLANSPGPAGGVGHGSGSSHVGRPIVLRQ
jgi:hypothetical protein